MTQTAEFKAELYAQRLKRYRRDLGCGFIVVLFVSLVALAVFLFVIAFLVLLPIELIWGSETSGPAALACVAVAMVGAAIVAVWQYRVTCGDLKRDFENSCPTCSDTSVLYFDWEQGGTPEYNLSLRFVRRLKFGELHECVSCGQCYFIHEGKRAADHVHDRKLLERWDATDFALSLEQRQMFERIGPSPYPLYRWRPNVPPAEDFALCVPCQAKLKDGRTCNAIAVISQALPKFLDRKYTFFPDDVLALIESDDALPADIRWHASSFGLEEYWPFPIIVAPDGRRLIAAMDQLFLSDEGVKGSEVRLVEVADDRPKDLRHASEPEEGPIYIYFDWFEGCEKLLDPP